jgi:outer membrane lipase/esterase
MKFHFRLVAAMLTATSLALAVSAPANATIYRTGGGYSISDMVVFGDSLSDVGNIYAATGGAVPPEALGYSTGRFTNGGNYTDYLAASLGVSNVASLWSPQGNNYAFGGAKIDAGISPPGLLAQYGMFAGSHAVADPNALFVVYGGGNDINDLTTSLADSVANLAIILGGLIGQGATNILIPNSPDLGRTPDNNTTPDVALKNARTVEYNTRLAALVAAIEAQFAIDLLTFDVFGLSGGILDNPTPYGLSNVTQSCLVGLVACANPDDYFYWDGIHPTTDMHALLAAGLLSVIDEHAVPAPATLALTLAGLLSLAFTRRRRHG